MEVSTYIIKISFDNLSIRCIVFFFGILQVLQIVEAGGRTGKQGIDKNAAIWTPFTFDFQGFPFTEWRTWMYMASEMFPAAYMASDVDDEASKLHRQFQ